MAKQLEWIRQGDVAFVRCDTEVRGYQRTNGKAIRGKTLVVAEGEVTGHAHVLTGDLKYDREQEPAFVKVNGVATLTHQEHATVEIPDGTWRIVRQREFWGEERRVAD